MLASPHGASVLNIWIETLEGTAKGGRCPFSEHALSGSSGSIVADEGQGPTKSLL